MLRTRDLQRLNAVDDAARADGEPGGAQQPGEVHHVLGKLAFLQAAAAAFASVTRRVASSPAMRSRSSRYLSSTPRVLFTVSGSSVTRSRATRQFAQSMVSATPGSLNRSLLRSCCTNATTSRESDAAAPGGLRPR